MTHDPRCCGSGTCIIDGEGRCWCGQQWDGEKMCHPPLQQIEASSPSAAPQQLAPARAGGRMAAAGPLPRPTEDQT